MYITCSELTVFMYWTGKSMNNLFSYYEISGPDICSLISGSELVVFMYWTGKSMNNRLSYCGLVDPRISASDKELLVLRTDTNHKHLGVDILLYCKSHPLENWSDFIKMLYVILLKQTLQFIQYF